MRKQLFPLLTLVFISAMALAGCMGSRSSSSSSPLMHGLSQEPTGAASQGVSAVKVVKVVPGVVAIYNGKAEKLQAGMSVPACAILRSDATGKAQLSFADGTSMNISPNSEIALADVAPAGSAAGQSEGLGAGLARRLSSKFGAARAEPSAQGAIGIRGLQGAQ